MSAQNVVVKTLSIKYGLRSTTIIIAQMNLRGRKKQIDTAIIAVNMLISRKLKNNHGHDRNNNTSKNL